MNNNLNPKLNISDKILSELMKSNPKPYVNETSCYSLDTLKSFIRYRSAEFDQWWDRSLIPDSKLKLASVSEYLCTYCSYRFDIWYNKNLFNNDCYSYLFLYCKKNFDKWFEKKLFKEYVHKERPGKAVIKIKDYDIETIFVSELLMRPWLIHDLYKFFPNKKHIWLNKDTIDFNLKYVCPNLLHYCGKDIEIWFNKDKFQYTQETCELFSTKFEDVDSRKSFKKTFMMWWDEEKFNFEWIVKDQRNITSWENLYSEYKQHWQKKLMLEKLKR